MDEFKTINDLIAETVKQSSYVTAIISSVIFIIYTLIVRIFDVVKSKNKDKPLLEMASAIKENTQNIVKLNEVLDETFKNAEKKKLRQCEKAIECAFKSFGFKLVQETTAIIAHNNINVNRQLIVDNINKLVSTEYYNLYSTLSIYEIKGLTISSKLKEEWIKEVSNTIINIIYDNQDSIARVTLMTNRLSIYMNEYTTYVVSKSFN